MDPVLIYTDGACSGNPGPGGWAAVLAYPDGRVVELGGGEARTTNNRMELRAVIEALMLARSFEGEIRLFADSTYVLHGIKTWVAGWRRRGWKTSTGEPVMNRELWEALWALTEELKGRLALSYIRGHTGHPAHDRIDQIAVAFSKGRAPELFGGWRKDYGFDLTPPASEALPERGESKPKGAAVYLSFLDGKLQRHASWEECKKVVHGKPAKFKKVSSAQEEAATLKEWGVS